ncbi:hypothetical protein [Flavobacterium psychrotrophum]|uniref:hypothetical protein n=1 Tax=Flavobacterium psychrotrophum TaxID=2294119 RepID=UPI0013C4BFE1|nr:hypothetical protein [Flavobacterium psychrotrophum]
MQEVLNFKKKLNLTRYEYTYLKTKLFDYPPAMLNDLTNIWSVHAGIAGRLLSLIIVMTRRNVIDDSNL